MKLVRCVGLSIVSVVSFQASAASMLRVSCYGNDVGSQVYVNERFKGECPVDVEINLTQFTLRVQKGADHDVDAKIFQRDMRMGDGVVKKIEVDFNTVDPIEQERRQAALRQAEAKRLQDEQMAAEKRRQEDTERQVLNGLHATMVAIPGQKFELGKFEVTQLQWKTIMGSNPSHFVECGLDCPVENVSWNEAQEFINKLNQRTGRHYRLPTESEWKYACDAGQTYEFCGGNELEALAWYSANSSAKTSLVGKKQKNEFGLFDMTGNVWEWMNDCWRDDCSERVLRGGSWKSEPQHLRANFRNVFQADQRSDSYGLRLARTLP